MAMYLAKALVIYYNESEEEVGYCGTISSLVHKSWLRATLKYELAKVGKSHLHLDHDGKPLDLSRLDLSS